MARFWRRMGVGVMVAALAGCAAGAATQPAATRPGGFGPGGFGGPQVSSPVDDRPDILIRHIDSSEDVTVIAMMLHELLEVEARGMERSNVIVVTGKTSVLNLAKNVLDTFDKSDDRELGRLTFIYPLKHARAVETGAVLNRLFDRGMLRPLDPRDETPIFAIADPRTNALARQGRVQCGQWEKSMPSGKHKVMRSRTSSGCDSRCSGSFDRRCETDEPPS